jgi:hypothetical protein
MFFVEFLIFFHPYLTSNLSLVLLTDATPIGLPHRLRDGASHWTQNLTSAAWALYSPSHELLHTNNICLGSATNNQAEYTIVIGLLTEASPSPYSSP